MNINRLLDAHEEKQMPAQRRYTALITLGDGGDALEVSITSTSHKAAWKRAVDHAFKICADAKMGFWPERIEMVRHSILVGD